LQRTFDILLEIERIESKRCPVYTKAVTLDVLLQHLGGVFGNPLPPGASIDEEKSKTAVGGKSGSTRLRGNDLAGIEAHPTERCGGGTPPLTRRRLEWRCHTFNL
jgi:hypothetical protein